MGICCGILLELDNGLGCLLDGHPIGVHGFDDVVVVKDATRNLAMGAQVGGSGKSEAGKEAKECFFHDPANLDPSEQDASEMLKGARTLSLKDGLSLRASAKGQNVFAPLTAY